MKRFMDQSFLLSNATAERLFHEYAQGLPIFDYHCHLSPGRIASNERFADLADAWLAGDHYKWRAMRTNGVDERFITGDATPRDKFQKWAETVPATVGNPLYHWTHMEMRKPFGIDDVLLSARTAESVWKRMNERLADPAYTPRGILSAMNVRYVGTTDDPTDDLRPHEEIAADSSCSVVVKPSFRPDKTYDTRAGSAYRAYLNRLSTVAGVGPIRTFADLQTALVARIDYFHDHGCRVSDHALVLPVNRDYTERQLNGVLAATGDGGTVANEDAEAFTTAVLDFLGREYSIRGWTMQLHIGALRNTNTRMFAMLGPDTGFDSMADGRMAAPLAGFLDRLDRDDRLPRTILYVLNPRDNDLVASMTGNFQDGSVPGKIQFGSGWWFNDTKDGMMRQMTALANASLLSRFVGMLTDSRSFLSFPRHEYFRRVLCNLIGSWVEAGEAPSDIPLLGEIVQNICWHNAVRYFGIPGLEE